MSTGNNEKHFVSSEHVRKATDIQDYQRHRGTSVIPINVIIEVLECIDRLKAEYGDDW